MGGLYIVHGIFKKNALSELHHRFLMQTAEAVLQYDSLINPVSSSCGLSPADAGASGIGSRHKWSVRNRHRLQFERGGGRFAWRRRRCRRRRRRRCRRRRRRRRSAQAQRQEEEVGRGGSSKLGRGGGGVHNILYFLKVLIALIALTLNVTKMFLFTSILWAKKNVIFMQMTLNSLHVNELIFFTKGKA